MGSIVTPDAAHARLDRQRSQGTAFVLKQCVASLTQFIDQAKRGPAPAWVKPFLMSHMGLIGKSDCKDTIPEGLPNLETIQEHKNRLCNVPGLQLFLD